MTCCWLTGDPIANIKLLEDPGKNLVVIMKDGKVYKNTLGHRRGTLRDIVIKQTSEAK